MSTSKRGRSSSCSAGGGDPAVCQGWQSEKLVLSLTYLWLNTYKEIWKDCSDRGIWHSKASQLLSWSCASVQKEGTSLLQLSLVLMWHYKVHPDVTLEVSCSLFWPIIIKILVIANLGFCAVLRSSQEINFQFTMRAEWKTGQQIKMFPGQDKRLLPLDSYRRSLFRWMSARALISDTLQAAISFGESLFPNISTARLRVDSAMEIPVSCFGPLSMLLQCWSLCFVQWSKIFSCTWALGWVAFHRNGLAAM